MSQEYLKGLTAKQVRDYLSSLFEELRQHYFEEWKTSEPEKWSSIKNKLEVIDRLESLITSHVVGGEMAKKEMEELGEGANQ